LKKIVSFLQQFAVAIGIFYAFSPLILNIVAVQLGNPYATLLCWFLALTGTFITALLLWYLTAEWQVARRGYFIAVGFGGFLGMILGWISLAYLNGFVDNEVQQTMVSIAKNLGFGVLLGFFVEWVIQPILDLIKIK
jgi:hypothetical protein